MREGLGMKARTIVVVVAVVVGVWSALIGLAPRKTARPLYDDLTSAQRDSIRSLSAQWRTADSVAKIRAANADRARSQKYAAAIRECRAAGVCGEFRTVGDAFTEVWVGAPWYGLPYDQKVSLAIIIKHQTRLRDDIGGVFFLDKYTGKTVAELSAMGFSVK
jgi:hypothetical protein